MKEYLITGGTGSLGKVLVQKLLFETTRDLTSPDNVKGIRVYSRDEEKHRRLEAGLLRRCPKPWPAKVAFHIGDTRDRDRLRRAMQGVNVVIHAAAMKQVPACNDDPLEAIKTNIVGASNVVDCALDAGVDCVMNVSTDKAVAPANLYGATKMVAEKLMVAANVYRGSAGSTRFSCCRYGNVLGSRGSVLQMWSEQLLSGKTHLTGTDPRMSRFWMSLPQAADFVLGCIYLMKGGEIFIPKIPSMMLPEMARVWCELVRGPHDGTAAGEELEMEWTGIRLDEKLAEALITPEEGRHCTEHESYYTIHRKAINDQQVFDLTSDANPLSMDGEALNRMLMEGRQYEL